MECDDYMNDTEYIHNEPYDTELPSFKQKDRGYNRVYRKRIRTSDGKLVNMPVDVYSSGDVGSRIRNAETGQYYDFAVGSKKENLFFKVSLATGECTSLNGSHTLFYLSPNHYMSHLDAYLEPSEQIAWWDKYNKLPKENIPKQRREW
jgi:hypothetical protein